MTTRTEYINKIKQIPLLTDVEEIELFTRIIKNGCKASIDKVITHNLRFVVHIAYQYRHSAMEDLIQEGNIGLMRAIKTFSLEFGVKFVTYANSWIKSSILDYLANNGGVVKFATTKAKRKILFNSSKLYYNGIVRDFNIVSEELNVSVDDIQAFLAYSNGFQSIHSDVGDIEFEDINNNINTMISDDYKEYQYANLKAAMSLLPERSRDIITDRYMKDDKLSLSDLATKHSISLNRVHQIQKESLFKLKNILSEI